MKALQKKLLSVLAVCALLIFVAVGVHRDSLFRADADETAETDVPEPVESAKENAY